MAFKIKKRWQKANIVIFSGFLLIPFFLSAQENTVSLQWHKAGPDSFHFEGAYHSVEGKNFPWFVKGISLNQAREQLHFTPLETDTISNPSLTQKQLAFLSTDFSVEKPLGYKKKQPIKTLKILPLKLTEANELVILKSFGYRVTSGENVEQSRSKLKQQDSSDWKNESVLARHDWYKIPVEKSGVHKITYDYLKNLGLDPDEISPDNIHLYGNGGQMLPLRNAVNTPDDLRENAIRIRGGDDGSFDENDYILFYAMGPHSWDYRSGQGNYAHQKHDYADQGYYFLSVHDKENNKRIASQPSLASADYTSNQYDELHFHEKEVITDINRNVKTGRDWFGETFERTTSKNFNFKLHNEASALFLKTSVADRGSNGGRFAVKVNGQRRLDIGFSGVNIHNHTGNYCSVKHKSAEFSANASEFDVTLDYQQTGSSIGWLDYIELQARSRLAFQNEQFTFRDHKALEHETARYNITNHGANLKVWDVSNPYQAHRQSLEKDNGQHYFIDQGNDTLHQYVAFNDNAVFAPKAGHKIANQNLHGLAQADMLIITHPSLRQQAERLADYHRNRDDMQVHVESPGRIYNEFSSGNQDVAAIRDFVKMFYDRAGSQEQQPEHLLLFGDASYDYKDRFDDNTNLVPTYQSLNAYAPLNSYATDDFYGYLDNNEGYLPNPSGNFLLDINIGRIPASNSKEARAVVDKIYRYHNHDNTFGDWQNMVTFMADDMDDPSWEAKHLEDSEKLANILNNNYPSFNMDKIYMDAFPQVTKSSGTRYPEANKAFNRRIENGTLILNYIGHGGERGLAHEKILTEADIESWSNKNKLPLFITATCEFSRFDDPEFQSAGEKTLVKPDGGVIALLSTTRVVNASPNFILNRSVFKNNLFEREDGEHRTLGGIMTTAKNRIEQGWFRSNNRKFALLGDPALKLAYPREEITTTRINSQSYSENDSLKALQKVTLEGKVQNQNGALLESFNGTLYPTIYDKKVEQITLANDEGAEKLPFKLRSSIIYKGKASVNNGKFKFDFIVPKDISYTAGEGKISYYATNKQNDAHGHAFIQVGGTADSPIQDDQPPEVNLYMNQTDFESGDVVGENPLMLAHVWDDYGINTAANGIGHQPTMQLDEQNPVILGNAYEANLDDSKSGTLRNQLFDLEEGRHTLTLKVWDVANNRGQETIEFVVAESAQMVVENIMNYPNPFSRETKFQFNHNQSGNPLQIEVRIFDMNGNHVHTLRDEVVPEGNQFSGLAWKGNNQNGVSLESGMYIYQVRLQNEANEVVTETDKLVIQK